MHYEPQFRIALGAILLAAFAVRLYGHSQTLRAGKIRWIEGKLNITLRIVAGLVGIAALWTYLIWPEWILWASVPLPAWLRWTGAATAGVGIGALAWVHRELGRNFAASLPVRAEGPHAGHNGPVSLGTQPNVRVDLSLIDLVFSDIGELGNRARLVRRIHCFDDLARSKGRSSDA